MDPPVAIATILLLGVLGWRLALAGSAPVPVNVASLFPPRSTAPADSGRRVLVVDEHDRAALAALASREQALVRSAEIHPVPWTRAPGARSKAARVAALVRAYGYSELPVLVTLTPGGQVVRVQSLVDASR